MVSTSPRQPRPLPPKAQPAGPPDGSPHPPTPRSATAAAVAALVALSTAFGSLAAPAPPFTCSVELPARGAARAGLVADPEATRTFGIQKVLYLRVRFADDLEDPVPEEEAVTNLQDADAYFRRMSYGQYGLSSTVTPVIPLARLRADYDNPSGFNTLLDDARQAGIEAGYDYRNYDLEIVRHIAIPSFFGGTARVGARGVQVQAGGSLILLHEIGHNLGLLHGNFWDASGPGIALGSPPLPSNYESIPDLRSVPFHPDSVISHDTVIGPGQSIEYGDSWDIMGTGDYDFSGAFKEALGWLPTNTITSAPVGVTSVRLYELTGVTPGDTRQRTVRVRGAFLTPTSPRDYGVELPSLRGGLPPAPGVLVRWLDLNPRPPGASLLLDGTPGSFESSGDAILPVGRTFSDPAAGVHITATAAGTNDAGLRWADVTVARGRFPANRPPAIHLTAATLAAAPDAPVSLQTDASDPDGDVLAYFWDFGDGSATTNTAALTKAWSRTGDFVVRVEVTDRKGGTASAHVAVRVGNSGARRITGVVRDLEGRPVAGARVHNGVDSGGRPQDTLIQTWTDSTGAYTLSGLPPVPCFPAAYHPDYVVSRQRRVDVSGGDQTGVDFTATVIPQVTVTAPPEVPESAGFTNLFTFTRTGATNDPMTVLYQIRGTAQAGRDYVYPQVTQVTIPAGHTSTTLPLALLNNSDVELPRSIAVGLLPPAEAERTDPQGRRFTVYYPGFEIVDFEGVAAWSRTRPYYRAGADSQATVQLLDDDQPPAPVILDLVARGDDQLQLTVGSAAGGTVLVETSADLVDWQPVQTVVLTDSDSAILLVPSLPGTRCFRAVRQ